jgi:hypothetical protein
MHEGKLKELYERLLECTCAATCEIEVRGHQVHVVETGDGLPLVLFTARREDRLSPRVWRTSYC